MVNSVITVTHFIQLTTATVCSKTVNDIHKQAT